MTGRTLTLRRAIVLVVAFGLLVPAIITSAFNWSLHYGANIEERTRELLEQNTRFLSVGLRESLVTLNQESGKALVDAMIESNPDIVRIDVQDRMLRDFISGERPERRTNRTDKTTHLVTYHGNVIGSVQVEIGSARLRDIMLDRLTDQLVAVIAQVVLSIILILLLLEKRLVRPLERLGKSAERLAERHLDTPFTWSRLDEIGLLSRRFEDTRISLRKLFSELDLKNKELEQDISKREQIEQELYERERRYRALVERSPIAIIEWDAHYQVIEWNAAAEEIFGFPREQAIGHHFNFITPLSGRATLTTMFERLRTSTGGLHGINQNIRADGQLISCYWSNATITEGTGLTDRRLSMVEDITEKRRAEQARGVSEAKFAGAFQCNPDSVSITRLSDGVIIDINQSAEESTGYTKEEAVGKTAAALGLWVNPQESAALYQQLSAHNLVRDFPMLMRTRQGAIRQCLSNGTLFHAGNELYMLTVVRDVTDQRLLESQKTEADRVLMQLAQGARYIAGESFFDLLLADLTSALRIDCAFIGLRDAKDVTQMYTVANHVRGQKVSNFRYAIAGTPCAQAIEGNICIYPCGIQQQFPDDVFLREQGWESYAGIPLRDAAGAMVGVLAVLHSAVLDNTDLVKTLLQVFGERASAELERKHAEEALRISEQRFSTIFQSTPVAMFVTLSSGDHVIKDVNRAFEQMFLYSHDAVLGKSTFDLDLYCNPADRLSLIAELMAHQNNCDRKNVWMRKSDGRRILAHLSGHTFLIGEERFEILACQDVTENDRIENEIRELNATLEERVIERTEALQQANDELATTLNTLSMAQEELVRSEKLAALGALVAGIAHELNTPIGNSVMVASTMADQSHDLKTRYAQDGGIKRSALEAYINDAGKAGDILMRNLQRAANLVTSFKQVAMDQTTSQRRRFSLDEVVSEIVLTLWPTFKKTSVIIEHAIPEALMFDSYPGPLGQVITNLLNNALLHGFEDHGEGTILITAIASEQDTIELTVTDDGLGITATNLTRIFDPFFTTRLGAGGSGLGLNITHQIVTGILGGRIRVQSTVGAGATFIVTLPIIAPSKDDADT